MFQEAFEKLEPAEIETILTHINPLLEDTQFDPADTTIMALDIPFYNAVRLLNIADHTVMPANKCFVLYNPVKSVVLNFTNEVIYSFNKEAPIQLDEENIEDYIRFFFNYVRGKHGRFLIVENIDDINWKEDPPPNARKAIGAMISPVILLDAYEDGSYHLECCMVFKGSLFRSNIDVDAQGTVNLTNEELLIEDMPLLDDMFGQ